MSVEQNQPRIQSKGGGMEVTPPLPLSSSWYIYPSLPTTKNVFLPQHLSILRFVCLFVRLLGFLFAVI